MHRLLGEERRQYWRTLPLPAFARVMLAVCLTFSSIAFAVDLIGGLRWPFWWVLAQAAFWGIYIASTLAISRNRKALFVVVPVVFLLIFVGGRIQSGLPSNKTLLGPGFEDIRWRLTMDGQLSIALAMAGFVIFLGFVVTQGLRHVRVRTELELAEKLQQTLAPLLAARNAGYEIHGRSIPSSQMGGDLLDAVDDGEAMACYVGDVAGHGIQAGVFMAMVKSAARTALLRPGSLEGLLADLNRVLFDVKAGSATYVTFACVRCRDAGRVEYSLAGNGPILHYHARSKTTSKLAMEQFPLGLFANATFQSGVAEVESGDILALLTDGLPEVEDTSDDQFGLERIGEIVARNTDRPLAELTEKLFAAVRRHGQQTDDETLVLVRAVAS